MQTYGLIGIGLVAGVASGLFGIGGGVVVVLFLTLGLGFTQAQASATSLVSLLLPVGILGVYRFYQSGVLTPAHAKSGLWISAGLFVGTYGGALLAGRVSNLLLTRLFALLLIGISVRTLISAR